MEKAADKFFEAISLIEKAKLDVIALIPAADALIDAGEFELSVVLYKFWLLANPDHPLRYVVAFNCGSNQLSRGDGAGAADSLAVAIAAKPDYFPARLNRGSALESLGARDAALAEWQTVVDQLATVSQANIAFKVMALKNIARIQAALGKDEAEPALRQAIELDPAQRELVQVWVTTRQAACMWPTLEPVGALSVRDIERTMAPLSASLYSDDPWMIKASAIVESSQAIARGETHNAFGRWPKPAEPSPTKLRIGYLSSDFCNHAVGYLIADIFEFCDRTRFEVTVFNLGQRTGDAIQQQIMARVDHWVDVGVMGDTEAEAAIVARGIDILLDMNGHTKKSRPGLLALKPAPIIINWLGYPGTMGSLFHDYIIADDFIIPEQYEAFYTEKVLRLPCYQPNGQLRATPELKHSRADLGLPDDAIVYCCFNGSTKINGDIFLVWMTILARVPNSVLWLRGVNADTEKRLRQEATARGVHPARLVFLSSRPNPEYLACHRYADIFLDTFPYGAHTTASDALRMGLPIVTIAGRGFASRVCGSLTRAAGMPETICTTIEDYIALAVELGCNREHREQLRQRLASQLPNCVLFDPKLLVTHLEALFEMAWANFCAGVVHRPNLDHIGEYLGHAVLPSAATNA